MESPHSGKHQGQVLIIGGGIAGIVTALELLNGGRSVVLVDRDSLERFGGLARWAFGGMAIVGTPEQKRMKIADSPELAFEDWVRFGELSTGEKWPRAASAASGRGAGSRVRIHFGHRKHPAPLRAPGRTP